MRVSSEDNCSHELSECDLGNRVFAEVISKDKVIPD